MVDIPRLFFGFIKGKIDIVIHPAGWNDSGTGQDCSFDFF